MLDSKLQVVVTPKLFKIGHMFFMNFFDHKGQGNHLLLYCILIKHPVFTCTGTFSLFRGVADVEYSWIYDCIKKKILNIGINIYNNLPSFIKRTWDYSKKFKSLLRNILYSNLFHTLDKYFNHNATFWWLYINILAMHMMIM
jgi:hypothetical protein